MDKPALIFVCSECGTETLKWQGQCPQCQRWNTLEQRSVTRRSAAVPVAPAPAAPLETLASTDAERLSTGMSELDRVLGGGLIPGSVTLLGGEPGIGKSTLLLQALARLARAGQRCLLVAAEESPQQVRLRAERLETVAPELWLVAETELDAIEGH